MLVSLQSTLVAMLKASFPDVYDGSPAPARLEFAAYDYAFDASSADPAAGQPTQDDAVDVLAFDPSAPAGPYHLTRPPYPTARRVYLRSAADDRQALTAAEVQWDAVDPRAFTLVPRPTRNLTAFNRVEVLYGVTAVFTQLKSAHTLVLAITASDAATAERAESLLLAAVALNRDALIAGAAFTHSGGGYTAHGTVKSLQLRKGSVPAAASRTLVLEAAIELKLGRALAADEGQPIQHISSPGKPPGAHQVNIDIGVES